MEKTIFNDNITDAFVVAMQLNIRFVIHLSGSSFFVGVQIFYDLGKTFQQDVDISFLRTVN